jgi:uncharacterized protein
MLELNSDWYSTNLMTFDEGEQSILFVADGSRIYDISKDLSLVINKLQADQPLTDIESLTINTLLNDLGILSHPAIGGIPPEVPKLNSISLNVAQACNMSCSYCYANEGKFGGATTLMKKQVAFDTIDKLFVESDPMAPLLVGFMGGEPLLARGVIHETVDYAWKKASAANRKIAFSITTNATLLTVEDAALFHRYPFTVTISIDGDEAVHNLQRKMHGGKNSYQKVVEGIRLIQQQPPSLLSARATVTPLSGNLLKLLDSLISIGFDDVGFSPVLVSPNAEIAFSKEDFDRFTSEMIACGEKALIEWSEGRTYPFGNFTTALEEIHKGTHRPYPCGAGAGYMSVNTKGQLFACHRLIDDQEFLMGNIYSPLDDGPRKNILQNKMVDLQEPCNSCWARYLCGGGCYHEIKHRGRIACDYIRDWLSFCLNAYIKLSNAKQQSI